MTVGSQDEWIANRLAGLCGPQQDPADGFHCVRRLMQRLAETDGKLGQSAAYHLNTGGKCLRARLALSGCAALDIDQNQAIHLAAACEFLHNASLVHDDIHDRDLQRRQQASVWHRYGLNTAITLGDFFLVLGFSALARIECSETSRSALDRAFSDRVTDVIRGQAKDLESTGHPRLTIREYEDLARAKAGALLSLPVEGALILSGASPGTRDNAHNCLSWFGVAYQLRDDLLDFCAPDGRGAAASDLRNAKPNAVILHYLSDSRNGERDALSEFLSRSAGLATADELERWAACIRGSNAFALAIDHFYACCRDSSEEADKLPHALAMVIKQFIAKIKQKVDQLDSRDLDKYRSARRAPSLMS